MESKWIILIIIGAIIYISFFIVFPIYINNKKWEEIKEKIENLINNQKEMTTHEFLNTFNIGKKNSRRINQLSIKKIGVYILHNKTKNKYYIGKSFNAIKRVKSHLTGYGNGKIYRDFANGNIFTIKIIKSTENNINELEKNTIIIYKRKNLRLYNEIL